MVGGGGLPEEMASELRPGGRTGLGGELGNGHLRKSEQEVPRP